MNPKKNKIGEYTIIERLGSGGFSDVFKALDARDRPVAIKIPHPHFRENKEVMQKVNDEVVGMSRLNHPNITKLYRFLYPCYIVMEYIEGKTLKEYLADRRNPLTFEKKMRFCKQAIDAFHYAYKMGVLHRDIKSTNIMIDKNDQVKIMDFGIAKVSSNATSNTARQMLSVQYAAPERFMSGKKIDVRSDIYSFGVLLYEIFSGQKPFETEDTSRLIYCHLNEKPQPIDTSNLPPQINSAILKALEKDPDQRCETFEALGKALGTGYQPKGKGVDTVSATAKIGAAADHTRVITPEKTIVIPDELKRGSTAGSKRSSFLMRKAFLPSVAVLLLLFASMFIFFNSPIKNMLKYHTDIIWSKLFGDKMAPDDLPRRINEKGFEEIKHPRDGSWMVYIPSGPSIKGSDKYDEGPMHKVYLESCFIDKYPVTNQQYRAFIKETKYVTDAEKNGYGMVKDNRWKKQKGAFWEKPDGIASIKGKENFPVTQVSYEDALAYCKWAGKDLPTEDQWEKAARGPNGNIFPWGNSEPNDSLCNYGMINGEPTPVDFYKKGQSYYGLYDMAGNVWQWCKDQYGQGEDSRIVKGGSFLELGADVFRSSCRDRYQPKSSRFNLGFRCVCSKITK